MSKKILLFVFSLSFFVWSCTPDSQPDLETNSLTKVNNEVILDWTEAYLSVEKDLAGFRPSPTSRAIGYIYMAAYHTASPAMTDYKTLGEVLNIPNLPIAPVGSDFNYPAALNATMLEMLQDLFFNMSPNQHTLLKDLYERKRVQYVNASNLNMVVASERWGKQVALAILAYAQTDLEGASQVRDPRPSSYILPVFPGSWVPTAPDFGRAMFPFWGKVRTFAVNDNEIKGIPPPAYSTNPSSVYYKDMKEVSDAVRNTTYRSRWIAEFWSDDMVGLTFSPPARIIAIANQLAYNEKMGLAETLHFYMKLGLSINDASVAAWKNKYIFNVERPDTYIKEHIDRNFTPILGMAIGRPGISPSFPGYPSGHSTFASAGSGIFEEFFGKTYLFTDNCHKDRTEFYGAPRSFLTFKEMAEENAFSRIPLGVHPRFDCDEGLRLGWIVSRKVSSINFKK